MRNIVFHQTKASKMSTNITKLTLIIALVVVVKQIDAFQVSDCTAGLKPDGKLKSVSISACPDESGASCQLVRGQNASIEVDFDTEALFNSAKLEIYGQIGPLKIPFPISPSEACSHYGFDCPVQPNQTKQLKISLPVLRVYPKLDLTIELSLKDEKKNPILCVRFPAKLVDA